MEQTTSQPVGTAQRRLWAMVIVVAVAAVVIAVATARLAMDQEDDVYPAGSPEAALQDYFRAWHDGDDDEVYAMLSVSARTRLPRQEVSDAMRWSVEVPVRIWIDERTDREERVVLRLTIETTWDGLLGPDRQTHQQRVVMVQEDGTWKVDTPLLGYHAW